MRINSSARTVAAASIATLLSLSAAGAETAGRYTMTATDEGFLRLDTATGAVSQCKPNNDTFVCKAIADDTAAYADEIDRLGKENADLKREVARLKAGGASEPAAGSGLTLGDRDVELNLPSEAEVDRAISFIEKLAKKFKGLVEDLKKDEPVGTPL